MPAPMIQPPNEKPLPLTLLENALLLLMLGLIALRTTYIESPHIETMQSQFLNSEILSLLLSTVMLGCFSLWLIVSLLMNQLRWRKTWLGWGIGLFVAAGILSFFAASNKRTAITDLVLLVTPMLSAVFLVQWINSKQKIRLAVLLVIAVGIMAMAQCVDQLYASNDTMIQDYEQNPVEQIEKLGIEPDSLEHWMYEHRLYSKGVRGFLLTSNSAASFFLLAAFAALGLCIETFRQRKHPETLAAFVCYSLAFLFILGGLALTQSKGGIGALMLALLLLAALCLFGKKIWKHRLATVVLLLTGIVLASAAITAYGLKHGKLPGGNSMLVRWQYWQSTVKIIGDHFLTGVGGGNFQFLYPLYKNVAASETIMDPHNVMLSLLSQYGPLGLLAFLAAVLLPTWKCLQQRLTNPTLPAESAQPSNKWLWTGMLLVSLGMFSLLRPLLVDMAFLYQPGKESSAAYIVLYLVPAGVFLLAFGLLYAVSTGDISIQKRNHSLTIAMVCGVVAVLIHNLIDFAIFEPGVWNTFWLFIGLLIAIVHTNNEQDTKPILLGGGVRIFLVFGFLIVATSYFAMAVIGPMKAEMILRNSRNTTSFEEFEEKIKTAVAADKLSPRIASKAAGVLMQMCPPQQELNDLSPLEKAADYAAIAQQRNPAGFKPYRLQGEIYLMLFERAPNEKKTGYLQKAYEAFSEAQRRYPGSDRIHFNLGQITEELGQPAQALSHYQKAMEIEQAYQAQFKIMYPDRRPVISRLGNTDYTITKAKIEELQKKTGKKTE